MDECDHGRTKSVQGGFACAKCGMFLCQEEEFDPTGTEAHEPGAKLDGGKLLAGELIVAFPRAMEALVTIATYGAGKYSRHGFLHVPDASLRYLDACMRHLLKYGQGEYRDLESGLPHIDHALWNIAAIVELEKREDQSKFDIFEKDK